MPSRSLQHAINLVRTTHPEGAKRIKRGAGHSIAEPETDANSSTKIADELKLQQNESQGEDNWLESESTINN